MSRKRGVYIHIPFCVKKCNYCAFLSFPAGQDLKSNYVGALVKEIGLRARIAGCNNVKPEIDTIYIGGGTPSVLDAPQMRDIMAAIEKSFEIKPDAEITIEANPGTLGADDCEISSKLAAYKEMGFNRLSMGVQSMDDERLKFLGRIHSAEEVERDVKLAREAGFDNINLDLIFSVPGESTEDALSDAKKIIALGPEHISCYSLQIEEETPLAEQVEKGILTEVPDEEDRETYHKVCALIKDAGYEHYEISNFAKSQDAGAFSESTKDKSPYRSRHNSLYWDMSDYIACGLGASGFINGLRYKNISDIDEYMHSITDNNTLPTKEEYENLPFDNISEAVFTGLRRREGITYEEACLAYARNDSEDNSTLSADTSYDERKIFWDVFADAKEEAAEFVRQGFLIIDEKGLRLTELGIDISNQIMALFV